MIFQVIVKLTLDLVMAIFGVLPTLPAMSSSVSTALNWVTDQIASVIKVVDWIYGTTLTGVIFTLVIALFNFDWVYHSTMWLLTKIPLIGVKR